MGDSSCMRRLVNELQQMMDEPIAGMKVDLGRGREAGKSEDMRVWTVKVEGAEGTLYEGEHFLLQFQFTDQYPFDAPEVMFVGEHIPIHPHIYSNGHICLSILSDGWTPALSVQSVCLSILSMLSSCKVKERPEGNDYYVSTCNKNPSKTKWWFHDDDV